MHARWPNFSQMTFSVPIDEDILRSYPKEMSLWKNRSSLYTDRMSSLPKAGSILSRKDDSCMKAFCSRISIMAEDGYPFLHDKPFQTLMEALAVKYCKLPMTSADLLEDLKELLRRTIRESRPERGKVDLVICHDSKYIEPIAKLIDILTTSKGTFEDLYLVWDLYETFWCCHPVYTEYGVYHLDLVCEVIKKRWKDERGWIQYDKKEYGKAMRA